VNQPVLRPGLAPRSTTHAPNAALLIDFDNVTLGVRSDLTKELRTLLNSDIIKGKVAVQRAYADWRRYPQYIVPLSESSIDLIFAPAFGTNKKNATDIRLAIDAIELVFTRPEIGTFILLSGDSDFSTMVIKLKEYGKYVIGVGLRESASDLLIQNCDEYYSYSDLAGLSKEVDTPSTQRDPWELVQEAVVKMTQDGDVMRSDRLKQVMQELDPNFDERNAGHSRFSRFVLDAASRGLIACTKLDNGQYEVAPLVEVPPARATAPAGRRERGPRRDGRDRDSREREGRDREGRDGREPSRRGRRGGRGRRGNGARGEAPAREAEQEAPTASSGLTLARAFHLLGDALGELPQPVTGDTLRLRMVTLMGREDPLLDAERFPRLLRQANDAEIAEVRKVGDDEYEVSDSPMAAAQRTSRPPLEAEPAESEAVEERHEEEPEEARSEGRRPTLRFRRGSRGPMTREEIPMVGVVEVDEPRGSKVADSKPATKKRSSTKKKRKTSTKRRTKKKAATATAGPTGDEAPVPEAPADAPAPRKRSRRSRKKTT